MVDIALCLNETCEIKETCYRSKATPSEYMQTYANFKLNEDGICDHYWKMEND
jgi:hypothetical protein